MGVQDACISDLSQYRHTEELDLTVISPWQPCLLELVHCALLMGQMKFTCALWLALNMAATTADSKQNFKLKSLGTTLSQI